MNSKTDSKLAANNTDLDLINGLFTTSEAATVLLGVIDQKINFHKVHRLCLFEGNENEDCTYDNDRINQLKADRERIVNYLASLRGTGKKLRIKSTVHISIEE